MLKELGTGSALMFPTRWTLGKLTHFETVTEIEKLSGILVSGCEAITGVYMRLCDTIRECDLPDWKIRQSLSKHFPQPRVSEIMRVARAPVDVYMRYTTGFFGFRAALNECRLYNVTPTEALEHRRVKKAAARLVDLVGNGEIRVKDSIVTISKA